MTWAGSDLNPGKFLFTDYLDFTTEIPEMRRYPSVLQIAEKAFLHNNFINPETGYTPQQLVYGNTSGLSGICQMYKGKHNSISSVVRLPRGIHHTHEQVAPAPLGVNFP